MKKLIIVGVVIVLLEAVFGAWYLLNPSKRTNQKSLTPSSSSSVKPLSSAINNPSSLKITAPKLSFKKGETFEASIALSTAGKPSTASDVILQYDPSFLKPVKTTSPFSRGDAYDKLAFNALDIKSGIATVSAISEVNKNFNGEGILAKISFQALKAGQTEIVIKFTPNETRDSNIVSGGKDNLGMVENLNLEIKP